MARRSVLAVVGAAFVLALACVALLLVRAASREGEREPAADARGPSVGLADASYAASRSSSGAWYEIAFTEPQFADVRSNRRSGPEERLVALMNRAQRTLDVACYEFDLESVADAMARAARRGVRVRMVTDADTLNNSRERAVQAAFEKLRAADIPVVADNRRPIMHHKFTVVDAQWVETGSWNYTTSETYRNNNNAIVVESGALAQNYTVEFEKMFNQKQFGSAKATGVPYPTLSIAGARVENYFSPQDRAATHVVRWIGSARQRVHFMAFSFTHNGIGDAMLERAQAGVKVEGVFETAGSDSQFSEYRRMKQAGLDVLLDGNPGALHHKVILVDDRVSIFGSFNFSTSADRQNDENLLIVEDPGLAAAFEAEYQRIRTVALTPAARR
jgi:phosphatidylserine/phosphatidylglycerophosphate/cardiolipin synthase-like enzyme